MSQQEGPTAVEIKRTIWECGDCKWHERRRGETVTTWNIDFYYCLHPKMIDPKNYVTRIFIDYNDETPDWCPVLAKREETV